MGDVSPNLAKLESLVVNKSAGNYPAVSYPAIPSCTMRSHYSSLLKMFSRTYSYHQVTCSFWCTPSLLSTDGGTVRLCVQKLIFFK